MVDNMDGGINWPSDWPEWVTICLEKLYEFELENIVEHFAGAPEGIENIHLEQLAKKYAPAKKEYRHGNGPRCLGALVGGLEKMIDSPEAIEQQRKFDEVIDRIQSIDISSISTPSKKEMLAEIALLKPDDPKADKIRSQIEIVNERQIELTDLMPLLERMKAHLLHYIKPIIDKSETILSHKREAIKFCIKTATEQGDYGQRTDFINAYTDALKRTKIDSFQYMSPGEKMSNIIGMCWKDVVELENNARLKDWLVSIFGKPNVYNQAMVSKFCERKELDLGAKQGRPRSQDD